eukprot:1153025-Pelagomonas_calceolata.AAC.4
MAEQAGSLKEMLSQVWSQWRVCVFCQACLWQLSAAVGMAVLAGSLAVHPSAVPPMHCMPFMQTA